MGLSSLAIEKLIGCDNTILCVSHLCGLRATVPRSSLLPFPVNQGNAVMRKSNDVILI